MLAQAGSRLFLIIRENRVHGTLIPLVGILCLVENIKDLKVLLMGNGVVFVSMALGTGHGGSHPGGKGGVYPVYHGNIAKLLVVGSSLVVGLGIPVKGRGNVLVLRWVGQKIACQLINGELVEGHIFIERTDHIIPVRPDSTGHIIGISCGVCIAGKIEPHSCPVFSVSGTGEQIIHHLLISLRRRVLNKCIHFCRSGW